MAEHAKEKERGAVEDLIIKRLKPLNKKILRLKQYAAKDEGTLNADQKAALQQLPSLEAAARELEELIKQVEETELVTAAREREEREASDQRAAAARAAAIAEFQSQLVVPLGGFLSLHALLHPAKPSDTEHLTFAPLALPPRMQDEVLATDILRVGRMHADLIGGVVEPAVAVMNLLVAGATGEDEDDDRVHHLLELLAQAEPEGAAEVLLDGEEPPVITRGSAMAMPRGAALNFLQEDELAGEGGPGPEADYEIVEPVQLEMASAAVSAPETPVNVGVAQAQFDWANDEGDDAAAEARMAAALSGAATPAGDELVEGVAAVSLDKDVPTEKSSSQRGQQRKRKPRKDAGDKDKEPKEAKEKEPKKEGDKKPKEKKEKGEKKADAPREPRGKKEGKKDSGVDSDGFEVKTARRASGAPRGRGTGRGRGRGGASRGDRPASQQSENANGSAAKRVPANGKPKDAPKPEPKPKPSIYKTTQPTGPTSAPIF